MKKKDRQAIKKQLRDDDKKKTIECTNARFILTKNDYSSFLGLFLLSKAVFKFNNNRL